MDLDWFESPQIVALAIVAVVGLFAFLVWELTKRHPIVDLSLFRGRNFWTAHHTESGQCGGAAETTGAAH